MLEDIFPAVRRLSFLRDTFIPSVCFLSAAETLEVRVFSPLLLRPSMKHNPPPTILPRNNMRITSTGPISSGGMRPTQDLYRIQKHEQLTTVFIEYYNIVDYCMRLYARLEG